jgi:hypothetical protein
VLDRKETGHNVQTASTATLSSTNPQWRTTFHLCVSDPKEVLKLLIAHSVEQGASVGASLLELQRASGGRCALPCGG